MPVISYFVLYLELNVIGLLLPLVFFTQILRLFAVVFRKEIAIVISDVSQYLQLN